MPRRVDLFNHEFSWVLYALPCVGVWSAYLLCFFPGLMSPDSIYQWDQMVSLRINDIHPAIHTLTNWLITRLWFSPAAVAIVQILGLAIVFGLTMREMERWNVPLWARIVVTGLFSLSPVNGLMTITVWKDIPYAISMLAVWLLLLKVVRTNELALRSHRFLLGLSFALAGVSLYRHNGFPVVILIILTLMWLCEGHRRQILLTSILWAAIYLSATEPLYKGLQVEPAPPWILYSVPIHQVAALRRSTPLTLQETQFLNSIAPPSTWDSYNCYTNNSLLFDGQLDQAFFNENANAFLRTWLELVSRNPSTLASHQSCVTSLVWQIMQPPEGFLYTVELSIAANDFGLHTQSLLPQVQVFLTRVVEWSEQPAANWWFWRPALYLCFAMASVLATRLPRQHKVILLSLPIFQSAILCLFIVSQDFRFQYPVYIIGLLAPALIFAGPDDSRRAFLHQVA